QSRLLHRQRVDAEGAARRRRHVLSRQRSVAGEHRAHRSQHQVDDDGIEVFYFSSGMISSGSFTSMPARGGSFTSKPFMFAMIAASAALRVARRARSFHDSPARTAET